jgi:predicted DNA-binding transcriptional regulator YafY
VKSSANDLSMDVKSPMSRALRVHQIDNLLHNSAVVSLQTFLDTLEVSLPTFKRDLEFMRYQLNAPINFDRALNGYRFDKAEVGPRYELPGLWLNGSEAYALITANHLLENIEPGLLSQHVAPLKSRLLALLATEGVDPEAVSSKISLIQKMRRQMPLKHFQQIARGTLDSKRLTIVHFNRHTGEKSEREISPQRLVHYRENWYVDAWCHTREAIRSFAIDAIEGVVVLPTKTKTISAKKLDEILGTGYGIFRGAQRETAELCFSPNRAQWVSRLVWHLNQQTEWLEDGWFKVSFPYTDDRELISDILALVPDVRVLGPESLRQKLVKVMQQGLGLNGSAEQIS